MTGLPVEKTSGASGSYGEGLAWLDDHIQIVLEGVWDAYNQILGTILKDEGVNGGGKYQSSTWAER